MDTQKNDAGDNQGAGLSDDLSNKGSMPVLPKMPRAKATTSSSSSIGAEPPADLPFVDNEVDNNKASEIEVSEEQKEKSDVLKPMPKIVPGMRGPLPSVPTKPMKVSTAKYGIGMTSKKDVVANAPGAVSDVEVKQESISRPAIMPRKPAEVFKVKEVEKPKISVPKPPLAPEKIVDKEREDLLDKMEETSGSNVSGKNLPPPTAPLAVNVDRNIRPRRLVLVVVVLLLFIVGIFFLLWYFFTKADNSTSTPQPTASSLFSPAPSDGIIPTTPIPSADVLLQTDSDSDGLTDAQEIKLGTDPFKADTDGDGYTDDQELAAGYDPLISGGKLDSDRDGLADPDETCWGTDSHNPDTDGDGYLDGQEVINGFDPLVPSPNDKLTGAARCKI